MSTHNVCFCGEIKKISVFFVQNKPYLELWTTLRKTDIQLLLFTSPFSFILLLSLFMFWVVD